MIDNPLITLVVTTKNEEKNILNCLKSIKLQTYSNIEIVVVDNNSSDKTKEIAKQFTNHVYNLGPERSAQRNYGMIDVASGKYVAYFDADMILSPRLIEECVKFVGKTGARALHISETVLGRKYFSKVRRFERGFYDGTVVDGARFFDKKLFVCIGGFDEDLFRCGSGEDWDIDKKVKLHSKIYLLPNKSAAELKDPHQATWWFKDYIEERGVGFSQSYVGIYHNESEFDLLTYVKKKFYYSKGFDGYISKWGCDDPDIKKQFGLIYRYLTVFTENGKWKRIPYNLGLVIGMFSLRFVIGVAYLARKLCKK